MCASVLIADPPSFDYEPAEDHFDENEPEDFIDPDQIAHADDAQVNGDYPRGEPGESHIVSGDPNAGSSRDKVVQQSREKKVPNDQRTTTPYMTKYERARVLGTRALQIRLVLPSSKKDLACVAGG